MSLNYTTSTLTSKQKEFIELYSEDTLNLDWVHTQVTFYMQLFNHKHEWCLLSSCCRIPQTPSFRNSGHIPVIMQHHQIIVPQVVPRPSASDSQSQNPSQFLSPLLGPRPWNPWLTKHGNYIPSEKMDGAQLWLLFSLVFTQMCILFPVLACWPCLESMSQAVLPVRY